MSPCNARIWVFFVPCASADSHWLFSRRQLKLCRFIRTIAIANAIEAVYHEIRML